jgi:uncharacterized protein (TIGR01777 family)
VVLTRSPKAAHELQWDGRTLGPWAENLADADAIVNFTGRSVNCIYNEKNRVEIIESRINSVRVLHEAIDRLPEEKRPTVFIQAASLAIFGDTTACCDEGSAHGEGFSVEVCQAWEKAFYATPISSVRKCLLRIGFVLGANGGALEPLRNLTRFCLGGTVGSGEQYISWLHAEDLNRMILRCIEDSALEGTFNATGAQAVTNREFMRAMRKALGRPWSPPAPAVLVRLGARLVLRTEASLALTGRNCVPARFEDAGFQLTHTDLDQSLQGIMAEWE